METRSDQAARMATHVNILGGLYLAFSIIGLIAAVVIFIVLLFAGVVSRDETALFVTGIVGISIAGLLLILSLPGIIGGLGLFKRRAWARILVVVLGVLNLVNVPLGTFLGVYTLWVLMNEDTERLFASGKSPAAR